MTVPAKPVEVGSRCFRSVAQLREFVDRAIASGGIDHDFALALFARHRHGASLSGAGISHFTIEQVREARSIVLHRIDGSRVTLVKRRLIAEYRVCIARYRRREAGLGDRREISRLP